MIQYVRRHLGVKLLLSYLAIVLVGGAVLAVITSEGGRITVTAKRVGDAVEIAVKDTGFGITAEHMPHIFERFYRVDSSRSRRTGGGSGIGLTIARALVEVHGGNIWAESGGEGQGSTFAFTLHAMS